APAIVRDAEGETFFVFHQRADAGDLAFAVQSSGELAAWADVAEGSESVKLQSNVEAGDGMREVTYKVTKNERLRYFLRVNVRLEE
ncbi:MAG: hypothetical protein AAF514_03420, partial [Verrucomicrobiota bacterium]